MKRLLSILLITSLLCVLCAGFFACADSGSEKEETIQMLFLGDSITEGIAGISPLTERENYAFYGIAGNCNDFTYYNRGVSGYTTDDFLAYVKHEDDGINLVKSLIADSDIIYISIIGNDFLKSNRTRIMREVARNDYTTIRSLQATAAKNIEDTLAVIRSLNPDAQILMQNLYNPSESDSPLFVEHIRTYLSSVGVEPESYYELMDSIVHEINAVLTDFSEAHTTTDKKGVSHAPFELVDIYPAFERIHETDLPRWHRLFCGDGIHPSDEGHALIAGVLQNKLTELGVASPNALSQYKAIKALQLERLFGSAVLQSVAQSIAEAKSFDEVTNLYFRATEDLVPAVTSLTARTGEAFSETQRFKITLASAFGYEFTSMLSQNSYVEFRADGTYELYLSTLSLVPSLLRTLIQEQGSLDLGRYFPFDFDLLFPYISDIAPEIEPTDLKGIFNTLNTRYGFELSGINFEKESMKTICERFANEKVLIFDSADFLGKTLSLTCHGTYRLAKMKSKLTGTEYTAIYVNNQCGQGESYIRYTYTESANEKKVRMTNDVSRVAVEGTHA